MLDVTGLGHTFGTGAAAHDALDGISFRVEQGELVCIVGPSGCGKSTLLRAVAGLVQPSRGEVVLHGQRVRGAVPGDLAVVFQDYSRSLYPWLTADGNVELPLRHRKLSRSQRRQRVCDALAVVGLDDAGRRYPWQLSGGMQQRVAIARALACQPVLLLMDEPFASVDAQTRADLEDLLLRVRREQNSTVLLVTHDIDESVYVGDRVLVLSRSPGTLLANLPVELPKLRHQISTRSSPEFVGLRAEVARLLHRDQDAEPAGGADTPEQRWLAAEEAAAMTAADQPAPADPVSRDPAR
jgi:NitT/TauT family transport system ATP-binding protein